MGISVIGLQGRAGGVLKGVQLGGGQTGEWVLGGVSLELVECGIVLGLGSEMAWRGHTVVLPRGRCRKGERVLGIAGREGIGIGGGGWRKGIPIWGVKGYLYFEGEG
jgi:hypothetical protein